ncbi:MAG: NAD(+) synthase [Bacteroidales bacterium]|nr:NAD(+) synthase [Candidatus Liminaster caballi]
MQDKLNPDYGLLRVATAIPTVRVADVENNLQQHIEMIRSAHSQGVQVLAFPELSITGYTCADLFRHQPLLNAARTALMHLAEATRGIDMAVIVGAPLVWCNRLFNCAVLLGDGVIVGIVPKIYLPNYNEFYEARWFASGAEVPDGSMMELSTTDRKGKRIQQRVRFGKDLLFDFEGTTLGIEICEDLWVPMAPSNRMALAGAQVIVNLSCSDEVLGKHAYLRRMIEAQSGRLICAYVYASAGFGESSTDLVFAGKGIIAENGALLGESERFTMENQLMVRDVDVEKLKVLRQTQTTFHNLMDNAQASASQYHSEYYSHQLPRVGGYQTIQLTRLPAPDFAHDLKRFVAPRPFVPSSDDDMEMRCSEIFNIQVQGLVTRLNHIKCQSAVIGISGGLDSTLALLVTVQAFDKLGWDRKRIIGITMPGFGTSKRTRNNSNILMEGLGITQKEISIAKSVNQHFADLGIDSSVHDVTYENCQARERTQILMDASNQHNGIVIGTGDLSELCLGWCTYNGDHMSMYAVNTSIPKTLVKYLVKYVAIKWQDNEAYAKKVVPTLLDIIDTPISPELIPTDEKGDIAQKTEDLVGPYELHDFFLYHSFRFGASPKKVFMLAKKAFQLPEYADQREGTYDDETIKKWLKTFFRRFFQQQFKRSCLPDGPKVGTVSISPRGDWRMPSDAWASEWQKEIDAIV